MTISLDIAATVAAIATIVAAVGGILSARWAHKAKTSADTTVAQTNGPLTALSAEAAAQSRVLDLIQDGIRSLGHQIGEVRDDMGRMDIRLTAEVAALDAKISPPPAGTRRRSPAAGLGETPSQ